MGCHALLQNLPDSGIKPSSPASPALQADSLPLSYQGSLAQESAWSINVLQGLSKLVYRKCNVLAFSLPRPFKHHYDIYLFISLPKDKMNQSLLLFSRSVVSNSFRPHGLHTRLPCPSLYRSLPKFMSIDLMMPSNHLILCRPLLLLPSIFPSIRVFSKSLLFQYPILSLLTMHKQ